MNAFLVSLLMLALATPAFAQQTTTTPVAPAGAVATVPAKPQAIIVDGKKFFPLANARRFNGDPNSPAALQIVHHPRPAGFSARHTHTLPMAQSEDGSAAQTPSNSVLSVFEPPGSGTPHP